MEIHPIIPHDSLSGYVANEHIDHTTVTMTAGTGLTGGGTIAATRTFNVAANLAAINALAITDSNFIVGNGTTWVAESGATARTSIGLGTANTATFAKILVGDGAVGTPSMGFSNADAGDVGWYLSGADGTWALNAAIDGVKELYITDGALFLKDSSSAYYGYFTFAGTAMTVNRGFVIDLNDGARTLDLAGNLTVESSSVLNQDYSSDSTTVKWPQLTFDLTQDYVFNERGTTLAVQSQTVATSFGLELFNKDGDGTDGVYVSLYGIGTPASIDPRERLILAYQSGGPNFEIFTETLNGTVRPISIYTGANTTQLVLNIDNSIDMSGSLAVAGTSSAEQLTSTDDITMAGLFTNTPAAGDATVIVMDGATNARTYAGAAEIPYRFERTFSGTGASFNDVQNLASIMTFDYDYSGASIAAGTISIQGQYLGLLYSGDVTIATGFGGHKHNVRASNAYLNYTGDYTSTDRDITTQLAGTYCDSLYAGDSDMTNGKVLTVNNYGGYFLGRTTAAVATAGTPVINCFGGYFEASGNTNNTTVAYGGYFKAAGADTNYAIYTEAGSLRFGGVVNTTESYQVDGIQVVGNRIVDARCDDAVNSGDATTDGVIDALRDAMITHGLVAAA